MHSNRKKEKKTEKYRRTNKSKDRKANRWKVITFIRQIN
jgi:hypothetical protein